MMQIPVGVSNRHVHLSQHHLDQLIGCDLTCYRQLRQPGQFAAEQKVDLVGPKGTLKNVRVLGPVRQHTQVEVSKTDAVRLGIEPPVRDSGKLENSPGIILAGPAGKVELECGVIIAHRHIHMPQDLARKHGLVDKQMVAVSCGGDRALTFSAVLVRVNADYALEFHVDIDEANAALLSTGDTVKLEL